MRLPVLGEVFEGRYTIESALGEGGFAVVFRAWDQRTNRPVALKILRPDADGYDVTRASRFLREMKAVAALADPHTMTLYDFGRAANGLLFMVCELVEGRDLNEFVASGELDEGQVVSLMLQVLSSLREAHQMGMLHRDIKPANIRVQDREDGKLRIKVLDFGLATSISTEQKRLTADGHVIGTPRYMSPEQLSGGDLSPSTDLFSLSLVAAELLCGHGTRPPLSPAHGVREGLTTIVNRMGASLQTQRYPSATEAIADLRQLLSSAPPQPVAHRSRVIEEPRFRLDLTSVVVMAGLVVGAAIITLLLWPRSEPAPSSERVNARKMGVIPPPPRPTSVAEKEAEPKRVSDLPPCEREPQFRGHGNIRAVSGLSMWKQDVYIPTDTQMGERLGIAFIFSTTKPDPLIERGFAAMAARQRLALVPVKTPPAIPSYSDTSLTERYRNDPMYRLNIEAPFVLAATQLCTDPERTIAIIHQETNSGPQICGFQAFKAIIAVSSRPEPQACAHLPYLHITGAEDWKLPIDTPPEIPQPIRRTKNGRIVSSKDHPDAPHLRKLNACARGKQILPDYRAEWLRAGKCSDRSEGYTDRCELWSCDEPFAICTLETGRPWKPDDICYGTHSDGNGVIADIERFLAMTKVLEPDDSAAGSGGDVDLPD